MESKIIDKIINIIDLEFDVLLYNAMAEEANVKEIYNNIRKKLEDL